jgi:virulence factor Mce-like protein
VSNLPSDRSKAVRALSGLTITALLFGATYVGVRWAYGSFDDSYRLTATVPRAGQGLVRGSDVSYRGVDVGEVRGVELVDRQAEITLAMDPDFRMPEDAQVVVRPKTVFGEKFVDVTFPSGEQGPYLGDGDEIRNAESATEVEDFFEGSNDLFEAVDQEELATLITSMSEAAEGTGDDVARAWESGAEASALFADTLEPQLDALESWAEFQDAIRSTGSSFNEISANNELALEEFNANRAAYERVLSSLRPFAEDFASLLQASRPDIDTMLEQGDNVVRLLIANEDHLTEVIEGLGLYAQTFATGLSAERLPDGTAFAYFKNFIYRDGVEEVICTGLADAPPEFAPLRDAVLGFQSDFDCSDYFQPSSSSGGAPAPPELSPEQMSASGRLLVESIYGLVGAPEQDLPVGVDALVTALAAGSPQ